MRAVAAVFFVVASFFVATLARGRVASDDEDSKNKPTIIIQTVANQLAVQGKLDQTTSVDDMKEKIHAVLLGMEEDLKKNPELGAAKKDQPKDGKKGKKKKNDDDEGESGDDDEDEDSGDDEASGDDEDSVDDGEKKKKAASKKKTTKKDEDKPKKSKAPKKKSEGDEKTKKTEKKKKTTKKPASSDDDESDADDDQIIRKKTEKGSKAEKKDKPKKTKEAKSSKTAKDDESKSTSKKTDKKDSSSKTTKESATDAAKKPEVEAIDKKPPMGSENKDTTIDSKPSDQKTQAPDFEKKAATKKKLAPPTINQAELFAKREETKAPEQPKEEPKKAPEQPKEVKRPTADPIQTDADKPKTETKEIPTSKKPEANGGMQGYRLRDINPNFTTFNMLVLSLPTLAPANYEPALGALIKKLQAIEENDEDRAFLTLPKLGARSHADVSIEEFVELCEK